MAEQKWTAAIRPELHPAAQDLVKVYNDTYGSCTPGCCPEALAAVLDYMVDNPEKYVRPHPTLKGEFVVRLDDMAALLRGEQP